MDVGRLYNTSGPSENYHHPSSLQHSVFPLGMFVRNLVRAHTATHVLQAQLPHPHTPTPPCSKACTRLCYATLPRSMVFRTTIDFLSCKNQATIA